MNVVLDTNVIVSAFLSPMGKPATILQLVLRGDLSICFDTAILAEYEQVLGRDKFAGKLHQASIRRFFELLYDFGMQAICIPSQISMPDEADRKFYDVAKKAEAVLITGNKKHYPNESFIYNPVEFLIKINLAEEKEW